MLALLYMSVLATAATNVAWITEARAARLDQLTTWKLLVPIFGVILSVVVLREAQSAWAWVAPVPICLENEGGLPRPRWLTAR